MSEVTTAATGATGGSEGKPPLTDRLRSFVNEQMASGDAEESAAPETEGASTEEEGNEPESAAASAESEGESGEKSEAGDEKSQAWTAAEIAEFMEENPRWIDTLDRDGWSRVPAELRPILKAQHREVKRVAEELKRKAETAKPEASTEKANKSLSLEEIRELITDPETALYGFAEFTKMMLPVMLEEYGVPASALKKVVDKTSAEDRFEQAWDLAADEIPEIASFGDEDHASLQKIIAKDSGLLSDVRSGDVEKAARAIRKAARRHIDVRAAEARRREQEAATAKLKQVSKKAEANRSARGVSSVATAPASSGIRGEGESMKDFIRRQLREQT